MLKQRREKQQQIELVIMEQMVPEDHFLRKIDRAVDFGTVKSYAQNSLQAAERSVVMQWRDR